MGKSWITLVICIQLITQIINFVPTRTESMIMPDSSGTKQYSISISSGLKSGQLKLDCIVLGIGKGTTRGNVDHVLEPGKSFGWDFKLPKVVNPLGNYYTSYRCHFEWNEKKYDFQVWNGSNADPCGGGTVHWAVLEDGFYFQCAGGKDNWQKQVTWDSPPTSITEVYGQETHSILMSSGLKTGQLKVQCKSFGTIVKDDVEHVIEHVIEPGKSFGWDFVVQVPWLAGTNFYSCNVDWNGKRVDFNAWDGEWESCKGETTKTHWAFLEDGFYYRCVGGKHKWEKRFTWEGGIHLGPSVDNVH